MKKIVSLIVFFLPAISFSQKVYNIIGVHTQMTGVTGLPMANRIVKFNSTVVITDSVYKTITKQRTDSFTIVKKVNDNYFKITDGLKETIIHIVDQKTGKYAGFISEEFDKGTVFLYYE